MKVEARKGPEPTAGSLRSEPVQPAAASAATATREAFEKAIRNRRADVGKLLRGRLEQLTQVQVQDPTIFSPHRTAQILQHLIDVIVPHLGADAETEAVALALLHEEMQLQRDIEAHLETGVDHDR
ncbi:hypothetical protein IFT98_03020 [Pseudomonas sp. CFBP 8770]|uniref:hypothetical protein n=1 Tax=unclassified Pseudomonas TaxID=196821 RepID=UPI0017855234|nr:MULTISPECIES: hypothetical protein [unclassified Pseudomonas]MBD8472944.1 hypothetical protein [Pseudomonas sp. CFBP 8773]MBD8645953.1 hypothetical protein [Pseudomonas sp. CFBP 8770]